MKSPAYRQLKNVRGLTGWLCPVLGALGLLFFSARNMQAAGPEAIVFADDGRIPNSRLPLLIYRQAFPADTADLPAAIEKRYAENKWSGAWRAAVFPFHHYHSTTHEVLGVYRGTATLQFGGEKGREFEVRPGDVIVIPAGVGHKRVESTADFGVVGAYPEGKRWDLLRGEPGERPLADQNIAAVPLPKTDPVFGTSGPLLTIWGGKP